MRAKKKQGNRPKQDNTSQPSSFNPDKALQLHLETAMGIARALYGAAAEHVIAGRLAYFASPASGLEVAE